jgi:hypothetical protein
VECGKPICPKCAVRTDVGLKCEADAKGVELPKEALAMLRPSRTPLYLGLAGLAVLIVFALVLALKSGSDSGDKAQAPLPATGTWSDVPDLASVRGTTSAVVLKDGKVLVAGGGVGQIPVAAAELFDPGPGQWRPTGNLNTARRGHQAVVLQDGRVLVTGGIAGGDLLASAEVYDPASAKWTTTAPMNIPRLGHTLTLLSDGRVLATGGSSLDSASAAGGVQTIRPDSSAEIYNPATGTWRLTGGTMNAARFEHTAILLDDGRVLIAGGQGAPVSGQSPALASTELYDPAVDAFLKSNDLGDARFNHTATKLADRSVLVTGGIGGPNSDLSLSTAEVFTPAQSSWTRVGPLTQGRTGHTATLMADGRVLVAAGEQSARGTRRSLTSSEIYTPDKREWRSAGTMKCPRSEQSAALLGDGSVLVVAGDFAAPGQQPEPKGCAERFRP